MTVMVPKRARNMNPASPARAPHETNAPKTSRLVGSPAWTAASGFEPMAYSAAAPSQPLQQRPGRRRR